MLGAEGPENFGWGGAPTYAKAKWFLDWKTPEWRRSQLFLCNVSLFQKGELQIEESVESFTRFISRI